MGELYGYLNPRDDEGARALTPAERRDPVECQTRVLVKFVRPLRDCDKFEPDYIPTPQEILSRRVEIHAARGEAEVADALARTVPEEEPDFLAMPEAELRKTWLAAAGLQIHASECLEAAEIYTVGDLLDRGISHKTHCEHLDSEVLDSIVEFLTWLGRLGECRIQKAPTPYQREVAKQIKTGGPTRWQRKLAKRAKTTRAAVC